MASKNLYLNTTDYDLLIEDYNLKFTSDDAEFLSQKIENVLKTFKGEFFANETIGLPYFTEILGKRNDINPVITIFKNAILDIKEVQELVEFSVDYDGSLRVFSVDFTVISANGAEISETLEV